MEDWRRFAWIQGKNIMQNKNASEQIRWAEEKILYGGKYENSIAIKLQRNFLFSLAE